MCPRRSHERRIKREALAAERRAKALVLRQRGSSYAEIGDALGVCQERARVLVLKADRLANAPHWADKLPTRAIMFLINTGYHAMSELEAARAIVRMSEREFLAVRGVGRGALAAMRTWLASHQFKFKEEPWAGGSRTQGPKEISNARSPYADPGNDASN